LCEKTFFASFVPNKVVTLLGDLNGNYNVENPLESDDFGSLLYHWMECNNLSQVINEPTRITSIGATLLDLIITNCPGYFGNSGTLSPPENCDTDLFPLK
jgi:5-methylcytosine-specific restriction endonuclease McrBC regulatory subunit McrC